MTPQAIKELRTALGCTAKELARALGLEPSVVLSWEQGETFPTKRHVGEMEALRAKGPSAIPRPAKKGAQPPYRLLADPALWELVRKLLAHPELRRATTELAASYPDPNDTEG